MKRFTINKRTDNKTYLVKIEDNGRTHVSWVTATTEIGVIRKLYRLGVFDWLVDEADTGEEKEYWREKSKKIYRAESDLEVNSIIDISWWEIIIIELKPEEVPGVKVESREAPNFTTVKWWEFVDSTNLPSEFV